MPKVALGTKVPDFSLPSTGGETFSLKAAAGKALVIYFYPKDMTSGCTREAQDFRDRHAAFLAAGARVVGISRDSLAAHEKFKSQQRLPFELLSDADERVCGLFDVIR
ncbi:Alkyl hydroperoxide reductase/ Thiol specific antioxidant/ Mal allergen, partial [mine drainage metagenome]